LRYPYLTLDNLRTDSQLARRLPRDLACRLHAIPVAEDGGRITVAMADPDDVDAQSAVAEVLGTVPYVVQSDQAAIDALLADLWSVESPLQLLAYAPSLSAGDELSDPARLMAELLGARVSFLEAEGDSGPALDAVAERVVSQGYDLVICGRSCQPLIDRLFFGPVDCRAASRIPASLLLVQGFKWPFKRILMVVGQDSAETNEAALLWAERLARPSGASVTALAVVPPVPAMWEGMAGMRQGLAALLDADTFLGRELRRIGERLAEPGIEGRLRLRQGPPGWQLRLEVATGDHDLVIVGADRNDCWLRWLSGGQVAALLRWADRPVLIAKPVAGEAGCDHV
jgi:nucleotide-binding universal stress UspA family protein